MNLTITKNKKLLKQQRHKRFTEMNDKLLSGTCYWYAQAIGNSVPGKNENSIDKKYVRPDGIHT